MDDEEVDLLLTVVSYFLLFVLIFGLAGTVEYKEFRKQFKEWRAITVGLFGQFVVLPFLGFCSVKAFRLTSLGASDTEAGPVNATNATSDVNGALSDARGIEAVILLLTTSSPGGSYSNWWCFIFNADLALSVAMTTVSSIASVFMLPLNLAIYLNATGAEGIDIEYGPLIIAVAIVVGGIGCGLFMSRQFPLQRHIFHTSANLAGLSLIGLGMASTSGSNDGLFNQPWEFFSGVAAPCVIGLMLALTLSRAAGLIKPQCVSVGIETCYQNTALALSVALASPHPARAAAVPVFYQAVQVVCLLVFSLVSWKAGWTYAPADVSLWRMIVTNYQPFFQSDTELVTKELEKAKELVKAVEQASQGATPMPASPRRGTPSLFRSVVPGDGSEHLATPLHSQAVSRANESPSPARPGSIAGGSLSGSLAGTPYATPQAQLRPWNWEGFAGQPQPREMPLRTPMRTPSLGLGLGEIEEEAVAAVLATPMTPGETWEEDATTPIGLRQRVRALEELKIRLTRRSTRKISYKDFATMLQGARQFMGDAAAAVTRIPTRISETMAPMHRRLSDTMGSLGSSINSTLQVLSRGSPRSSPVASPSPGKRRSSYSNKVTPSPAGMESQTGMRGSKSLEQLHEAAATGTVNAQAGGGNGEHSGKPVLKRRNSEGSFDGSVRGGDEGVRGGKVLFENPGSENPGSSASRVSQGSTGSRASRGGRTSEGVSDRVGGLPPRHSTGGTLPSKTATGAMGTGAHPRVLTPLSNRPAVPDPKTPPAV